MNKIITGVVVLLLILAGVYYFFIKGSSDTLENPNPIGQNQNTNATSTATQNKEQTVIGKSVEGRDIIAYHIGEGENEILFIGGIHGGYEWNTSAVAFETLDYLKANPTLVPANVKVTIIPVLNPDGLNKIIGSAGRFATSSAPKSVASTVAGRFNANTVDLNRNFDCDWQTNATWQDKTVSGGSKPFSEPESIAIRDYVNNNRPTAVVVWYSSAGGVFASNCHNGVSAETRTLMNTFATASGYAAYENFDFYKTTGDMVNWFAKNTVPAISVLLTDHVNTEWTKNRRGVEAVIKYYAK